MASTDDLLALYDARMRTPPPVPPAGIAYERDGPLVRIVGGRRGAVGTPRDTGVRGAGLDRLIARQRDYFAARGEAVEWKVRGHDRPADLPDRLRAAGFVPEEPLTVLVGRAGEAAARPVLPDGVVLRRVEAADDMHRIAAMESAVWGQDCGWLGSDLAGRVAAAPDRIAVLAAEADGEVVCAAWAVLHPEGGVAGLRGGSTLPAWRGRGLYRALVAARARLAAARGLGYLHADASADSAPILRRLGFRAVATATPHVWTPPRP